MLLCRVITLSGLVTLGFATSLANAQGIHDSVLPHRYESNRSTQSIWRPNRWVAPGNSEIENGSRSSAQSTGFDNSRLVSASDSESQIQTISAEKIYQLSAPESVTQLDSNDQVIQPVSHRYAASGAAHGYVQHPANTKCWTHQFLPDGLLYRSYIAGEKEPRFGVSWLHDRNRGWRWEASLGGRAGIYRHGTTDPFHPEGWQVDIEGAAQPQLNPGESQDLDATDFRFGIPVTFRRGNFAFKTGYYHLSSHVGDEFLERNPGFQRINYVRESALLAAEYRFAEDWQVYGELGYALLVSGGAKPWEVQFGLEYSPISHGSFKGTPFAAVNVHLREEVNWGGSINLLAGWQWMRHRNSGALRTGFQFYNGKSMQYEFFEQDEQLVGFGIWYDY